jgi:2',3'-cyclic-nucleotide 2'-phosphodiesterase (5'-nucleotidase family)
MDPLAALSLAGNVCQFIEFALQVVSKGNKLRKAPDGLLIEHNDLYTASLKIIDLNNRLVTSAQEYCDHVGHSGIATDDEIERACEAMNQAANNLINILNKLRMPAHRGRWKSMRQAVKAVIGKSAVDAIKNELVVQRQRLDTALLSSLW